MNIQYTPGQNRALKLFEILDGAQPSNSKFHPVAVGRRLLLEGYGVKGCCHLMKIEGEAHYIEALNIDGKLVCAGGVFNDWNDVAHYKKGEINSSNGRPLKGGPAIFNINDKNWLGAKFMPRLESALLTLDKEIKNLDEEKIVNPQSKAEERGIEIFRVTKSIGSDLRLGVNSTVVVARQLKNEGFNVALKCNLFRVDAGSIVCIWLEFPEFGSVINEEGRLYDDFQVMIGDFKKSNSHFMIDSDTKFSRSTNTEIDVFSESSVGEKLFPHIVKEHANLASTLEMMSLHQSTPQIIENDNKTKPPRL